MKGMVIAGNYCMTSKELSQVCSYKCKSGAQTLGTMQGKEKESAARIKKFMTMMDSMTNKELDSPTPSSGSRRAASCASPAAPAFTPTTWANS